MCNAIPNNDSSGASPGDGDATNRPGEARTRAPMVRAELLGRHAHKSSSGVGVHIWRRGTSYIARGSYGGHRFGDTLGAGERQAEARLHEVLYEIGQGTFVLPNDRSKRQLGRPAVVRLTIRQLADEFLVEKRQTNGEQLAKDYRSRLATLIEFSETVNSRKRWPATADIDRQFAIEYKTQLASRVVNGSRDGHVPLAPDEITVAELLQSAGYATGGFGKWGLGDVGTTGVPEKQGFALFYGYYNQTHAHNYFPAFLVRNSKDVPMPGGNGVPGKQGKGDAYSQELIADETLKFIESNRDRPFFCYAAWTLPHGQFEVPDASAFADLPWSHPVKNHAAMIARLDADVGHVLHTLEQLGIERQTLVIFNSDNGAAGPGVKVFRSTAGLRGQKRHLYEGGIRMPQLMRWPGQIKTGTTTDLLTSHVDFLATACDLAGVKRPDNADGISLVPTILGKEQQETHDSLYWEIYEGPHPFQQAVRIDKWKGHRTALDGPLELYDLKQDVREKRNIASEHPKVVHQIEAIMRTEHVPNPNWRPQKLGDRSKRSKQVSRRRTK